MFDCLIIWSVLKSDFFCQVGTGRKASCLVQRTRRFKIDELGPWTDDQIDGDLS